MTVCIVQSVVVVSKTHYRLISDIRWLLFYLSSLDAPLAVDSLSLTDVDMLD